MASQIWAKDLPLDAAVHAFTVGEDPVLDRQLLPWDCVASAAHARALAAAGLLDPAEAAALVMELHALSGAPPEILPEQEDGHTALEAALVARLGETGKRIHLGRSRNDQVLTALRLLVRDALLDLGGRTHALAGAFRAFAEAHEAVPMPGYTHLRRAMPSSFGQWGAAFAEGLLEELEALDALLQRLDACPLGTAAGFGAPLPLDRELAARLLGFSRVQRSPMDAQNARGRHDLAVLGWIASVGFVLEKAFWDLALFSMEELGFVKLPDAFTTGSSLMPQKRNPDVVELGRARCAELRGLRAAAEQIACGLPSSYHRDHQLLKGPLLAGLGKLGELLDVTERLVAGLAVDAGAAADACTDELYATRAACERVRAGLPFRDAYRAVAGEVLTGTFVADRGPVSGASLGSPERLDLEGLAADLHAAGARLRRRRTRHQDVLNTIWEI